MMSVQIDPALHTVIFNELLIIDFMHSFISSIYRGPDEEVLPDLDDPLSYSKP